MKKAKKTAAAAVKTPTKAEAPGGSPPVKSALKATAKLPSSSAALAAAADPYLASAPSVMLSTGAAPAAVSGGTSKLAQAAAAMAGLGPAPGAPAEQPGSRKRAPDADERSRVAAAAEKERRNAKLRAVSRREAPDAPPLGARPLAAEGGADDDEAADATPAPAGPLAGNTLPSSLGCHPRLLKALGKMGFERLTTVQAAAWGPMIAAAGDVIIRSETGSGKTLAYALPLLHHHLVAADAAPIDRATGVLSLVLAPTRELADQVVAVFAQLTRAAAFVVVGAVHGGEDRHREKARLRKGVHVLVATPGRLLDHLQNTASVNVTALDSVVLDEADRLLDMGFERTLTACLRLLPPQVRKRVLVSATLTEAVQRLSHFALSKERTMVGSTEDRFEVPKGLRQNFVVVPCRARLHTLAAMLLFHLAAGATRIVVFVSTADSTELLYTLFSRVRSPFAAKGNKQQTRGFVDLAGPDGEGVAGTASNMPALFETVNFFKLHGNMTQVDRSAVVHAFRNVGATTAGGRGGGVLFCTDVAARGLDFPQVDWILHYDVPIDERCYVHRIGRTARIGKSGDSMLFLMPQEVPVLDHFAPFVGGRDRFVEKQQSVFLFHLAKLAHTNATAAWQASAAVLQRQLCATVREDDNLQRMALFAYQSYIRGYATFGREMKRYGVGQADQLHLGHVASSFAIDATPSDIQRRLNVKQIAKDEVAHGELAARGKHGQVHVEQRSGERYHGSLVQKAAQRSRDHREATKARAPAAVGEFDAE